MSRDGEPITLTATEFELLRYLMRNPKRVLSKAQILDRVWNYDFGGQANVVELYISYLRKKIDSGRSPMIHNHAWRRLRLEARRMTATASHGRTSLLFSPTRWTLRTRLVVALVALLSITVTTVGVLTVVSL